MTNTSSARERNGPTMTRVQRRSRERGMALVMVMIFTFLAVAGAVLFLDRTHVELSDSKLKAAAVKNLFAVHSALGRAHAVINESMNSTASLAANQNVALSAPEAVGYDKFVPSTNRTVAVRTVKPSSSFDANGDEIAPAGGYEALPTGWYVLEARTFEPLHSLVDGTELGALKLVRQYVRDGTPLSNNFLAVIDDDLGLGGSPVNPGKPAEGEIQTNKHLYIMTSSPYYANRLLAVDGVSYIAGASESGTVYLHPDNNFDAEPLYLPLPSSLTSNPSNPDDTLKSHALGPSPTGVSLVTANPSYTVTMNGVASAIDLKAAGGDATPTLQLNMASGDCAGLCVEGKIDTQITFQGDTMTIRMMKSTDNNKWIQVSGVPTPNNGVAFVDTLGDTARRTRMSGEISTRTTLATTANIDVTGSVKYVDEDGDYATKLVHDDDLEGVAEEDIGTVPDIGDSTSIAPTDPVTYLANSRPPGIAAEADDGFYDGTAVLGVVASKDIILKSSLSQNAEIAGAYLSLEKRMTLEGLTYNASGQLTGLSGANPFYINNGARSSIRRFGSLVSYKRPCTTVVTGSGSFLYGFKTGFSLFDENMKQTPPPFFPKDKKPMYLGWELRDLGVKAIN